MTTASRVAEVADLFCGDGEMRALCRAADWSATPLGSVSGWPQSLRTTVTTLLASRHPMFLWWGPDLVQFYNDAYRPSLAGGGRHPRALGMRGREFWTEIWDIIGPEIDGVMSRAESTWHVDQLVPIERNGRIEEVYWTYGYSPVLADDGRIGGTLVVCQETTETVRVVRRQRTLHRLAALARQPTVVATAATTTQVLASDVNDVPFALCFLIDEGRAEPTMAQAVGLPKGSGLVGADAWPLAASMQTGALLRRDLPVPIDLAADAPTSAVVVPLEHQGKTRPIGALVVGLNPKIPWDVAYEEFVRGAAREIGAQLTAREDEIERERLLRQLEIERSRLQEVFQQAPSFLAVLRGPTFVYELANEAYYQLVGSRALIGKPVFEALPETRGQGFEELLEGVVATGNPFVGREMPLAVVRSPGSEPESRFVDFVFFPLLEIDGTRSGVVVHGVDVTDQVRARREIERLLGVSEAARAAAEYANRAKAEFLAVMSHELRTPLNAIGGYAELVELGIHGPVTPAQSEALRRIQGSQRHLLGLINDVLNYTRVEAGAVHYELQPTPIGEALAACEALLAPQIRARDLTLRNDARDSTLLVSADGEKLRQILLNLLSNAVKFTEAGGTITARAEERGEMVAIAVQDTGRGIPSDQLERIFEPFVQVDARLTRTEQGVGLGLAISRDLARGMGGELTAVSVERVGSTFTLMLPRVPSPG